MVVGLPLPARALWGPGLVGTALSAQLVPPAAGPPVPRRGDRGLSLREEGCGPGPLGLSVEDGTLSMRAATDTICGKYATWRNFSCMSHRNRMDDPGWTRPRPGLTAAMSWRCAAGSGREAPLCRPGSMRLDPGRPPGACEPPPLHLQFPTRNPLSS